MKQAVMRYGAVAIVDLCLGRHGGSYNDGYYNPTTSSYYFNGDATENEPCRRYRGVG